MKIQFLLLFLFFSFVFQSKAQSSDQSILITNVRIFNGVDKDLKPGNVLIQGDSIAQVAYGITLENKGNATVIDGKNKTLIPGLIDAHTHVTIADISMGDAVHQYDWGYINIMATKAAKRYLLRGFTTIRNMGGNAIPLAKAIDEGLVPGPRIYPSGAFISQTGGHGDFGLPTDVPRSDGQFSYFEQIGFSAIADGKAEVLKRTREQLRQGATQIKMMAGGGISSDYDPIDVAQYSEDEFRAAVSATDNFGTYVAVHAYTPLAIQTAIRAGVKVIEHGHLIDEETAKFMAQHGTWLSIQPFMYEEKNSYPEGSENARKRDFVYQQTGKAYELAKKHRVKTAWGTDLFGSKEKADMENERLVALQNWYSPYEILKMVTSTNAELLHLSGPRDPYQNKKPLGQIKQGAYADLIIVDGNPMENINLLEDPKNNFLLIMKDGIIHKNKF